MGSKRWLWALFHTGSDHIQNSRSSMLKQASFRFKVQDSHYPSHVFRGQMKLRARRPHRPDCSHTHQTLTSTGLTSLLQEATAKTPLLTWHIPLSTTAALWRLSGRDRSWFKMHQSPPLQWLNDKEIVISGQNKSYSASFGLVEKWEGYNTESSPNADQIRGKFWRAGGMWTPYFSGL